MLPVIRAMTMLGITRLMASYDQLPPILALQEEKVPAAVRPMLRRLAGLAMRPRSLTKVMD